MPVEDVAQSTVDSDQPSTGSWGGAVLGLSLSTVDCATSSTGTSGSCQITQMTNNHVLYDTAQQTLNTASQFLALPHTDGLGAWEAATGGVRGGAGEDGAACAQV